MAISAEEALKYYKGQAHKVIVIAENGQRVQFPAEHIRPFIDSLGVNGYFRIRFDSHNKLIGLERIN
jgi:hypothetical protein